MTAPPGTAERPFIEPSLRDWIIARARSGAQPHELLRPFLERGWDEEAAVAAVEATMQGYLQEHAREHGLPLPVRVPSPIIPNGSSMLRAADRDVLVLASLRVPQLVLFSGLLDPAECAALIAIARPRRSRSTVVESATGAHAVHAARTSDTASFQRAETPLLERIERRVAALLDWPFENGEGLQVQCYGPLAEYQPHYDWLDPGSPGTARELRRGGQRRLLQLRPPPRADAHAACRRAGLRRRKVDRDEVAA